MDRSRAHPAPPRNSGCPRERSTRMSPSRRGGNMAPLDFGPYLCLLNSLSFMSLQRGFAHQSCFLRLITVPREIEALASC